MVLFSLTEPYLCVNRLNLASFVTTWMEPECNDLINESIGINMIDEAEYPSTTKIQNTCVLQSLCVASCS